MPKSKKPTVNPRRASSALKRIDEACRRAVLGKLAVRDIAGWTSPFGMSEAEFRVLWRLSTAADGVPHSRPAQELDQAELAAELADTVTKVDADRGVLAARLNGAGYTVNDISVARSAGRDCLSLSLPASEIPPSST